MRVVPVGKRIDTDRLRGGRDQLWAEAVAAHAKGETWWLDEAQDDQREAAAADYQVEDTWSEEVAGWLVGLPPGQSITTADVLNDALRIEPAKQDRGSQMRAAKIMRALGFETKLIRDGAGARPRRWVLSGN